MKGALVMDWEGFNRSTNGQGFLSTSSKRSKANFQGQCKRDDGEAAHLKQAFNAHRAP
jgi:hypothetical protein